MNDEMKSPLHKRNSKKVKMTYDDIVVSDTQTCSAAPTQWEGELRDGRHFYFRYRHGVARLGIGTDTEKAVTDSFIGKGVAHAIGDGLDGYMTDEEYRAEFVSLYREYPTAGS